MMPHHPAPKSGSAPSGKGRRDSLPRLGWREWVSLPDLDIPWIRAKVDTGAQTSTLHATVLRRETSGDATMIRFQLRAPNGVDLVCTAPLVDERMVRSSNGQEQLRPVIVTTLEIQGESWPVEMTLARRDRMGFSLLLGRQAVRNRFQVDPGRSYLTGKPASLDLHHPGPAGQSPHEEKA
ncbi:MAG: RimK/LysX family protein [Gemmatimonadota bacterium]